MTDGFAFLQFLHSTYSESEYLTESWRPISEVIRQHLQNSTDLQKSICPQSIYCQIYKSTCKGFKERLFNDLKTLISEHSFHLKQRLDESLKRLNDDRTATQMTSYLLQFINDLHQFHRAIELISPLFHYLETVYIKPRFQSTIEQQFILLYKTNLIEFHIRSIFHVLQQLVQTSESPSKETIGLLLDLMVELSPELAVKQRDLFRRYCNNEDVLNELTNNDDEMISSTPRTSSKRSVDVLPGEEDQPSAKRPMNTLKSPQSDQ